MRNGLLFGILLLWSLGSCQYFATQQTRKQKLVEKEISGIDWNQVDQYPLFEACDETASRFKQQDCFESTLLAHLATALTDFELTVEESVQDTLTIDFTVDNQGAIEVLSIEDHPLLAQEDPDLKTVLTQSLAELPHLQPALKRGVPVATRFRIPLVLKTHE